MSTRPFLNGPHEEVIASLSPDSRWLAFFDNQERQAYVTPFPVASSRWLIPAALLWPRDSKRVFYQEDAKLVVREIMPSSTFELGPPRVVFEKADVNVLDVMPDGTHFIGVRTLQQPKRPERIDLIEGFLDHLD